MSGGWRYDDIAAAIAHTDMVARGGFQVDPASDDGVPPMPNGDAVATVVIVGNIGGHIWPRFRADEPTGPDPLDEWTRSELTPIAARFGAMFIHPSDEPYQPFQRWAQRADDVWQSPIGLLIHPEHGLWHAYRGAFLFPEPVSGLPPMGGHVSPCLSCVERPCLSACPVDAFTVGHGSTVVDGQPAVASYDPVSCRGHVVDATVMPDCLHHGCAARVACPVNADGVYGPDQMEFHMRAFAGLGADWIADR